MTTIYGKHRGKVHDNLDPLMLGRLQVVVPRVTGLALNWALPCVPYAGPQVGWFAVPPIGADVWVEFEGGNPDLPIWSGCFWGEGQVPEPATPNFKIFKTETTTLIINDTPEAGGVFLTVSPPAVETEVTVSIDSAGLQVTVGESVLSMTPEDTITLLTPPAEMSVTAEAITLNLEPSNLVLSEEGVVVTSEDVNVTAAVTVEGEVNVTGGVQLEGDVNVVGGVQVEGAELTVSTGNVEVSAVAVEVEAAAIVLTGTLELNGLGEVNGDLLIDGQQPVVI